MTTLTPEILAEFERLDREFFEVANLDKDERATNRGQLLGALREHLPALIAAARELRAAQETIKLAQAFLPKVEWVDWERGEYYCPACDAHEPSGHNEGCAMDRILQYKAGEK